MNIVLVTHFYPAHGGGVEQVAAQLASRMAAQGAQVVWCASDGDAPPVLPGVRCEPMASFNGVERLSGFPYPLWSPASLRRLSRLVRAADAVHVHDCIYAGSLAAAWFARWYHKRLAVTQHIGLVPLPWFLRPMLGLANRIGAHMVLRRADGVAFISPVVRRYFESLVGRSPHFQDIPNGVDDCIFNPGNGNLRALRQALGFDPLRPLMLFVGRFVAKKRLPTIREMALLRPHWHWCIIGHGPEHPHGWGLANVTVLPPMAQSDLVRYYRAADLLVLPSEGEGFPLVVQEAMACGLPAFITSEVASGSNIDASLWVELPQAGAETPLRGVGVIDAWLATAPARLQAQREACARFAATTWRWKAAADAHARWLAGEGHA